jgi:hypothetical protein
MKYKIGDKVKVNMKEMVCADAASFFVESLPNSITKVRRIFGKMYFLEGVPFVIPEECLEEVLDPIDSRFDILDL